MSSITHWQAQQPAPDRRTPTHTLHSWGHPDPSAGPGACAARLGSMPEPSKGRHLPRGWLAETCRTPASVALREHLAEGAQEALEPQLHWASLWVASLQPLADVLQSDRTGRVERRCCKASARALWRPGELKSDGGGLHWRLRAGQPFESEGLWGQTRSQRPSGQSTCPRGSRPSPPVLLRPSLAGEQPSPCRKSPNLHAHLIRNALTEVSRTMSDQQSGCHSPTKLTRTLTTAVRNLVSHVLAPQWTEHAFPEH